MSLSSALPTDQLLFSSVASSLMIRPVCTPLMATSANGSHSAPLASCSLAVAGCASSSAALFWLPTSQSAWRARFAFSTKSLHSASTSPLRVALRSLQHWLRYASTVMESCSSVRLSTRAAAPAAEGRGEKDGPPAGSPAPPSRARAGRGERAPASAPATMAMTI